MILVATAHGESLLDLVDSYALNSILGGLETVILGDKERKERGIDVKTGSAKEDQHLMLRLNCKEGRDG